MIEKPRPGFERRQLLRALGITAAAAPLFPALDGWAAPTATPRRLLLVFSSGGVVPERFWPTADGGAPGPPASAGATLPAESTAFSFAPDSSLAPLAPYRQHVVIVNNVRRKLDRLGGAHERAMGALWTGARLNPGDQFGGGGWPSGPSVDQVIARGLPRTSDFASLEIAVQPFGPGARGGTMQHMCYAGSNQPVPPEGNPYKLFDRLYGAAPAGSGISPDQIRAERRSVIDLVRSEISATTARAGIGRDDRRKIDAHLEATRAIERRLHAVTPKSCLVPLPSGRIDLDANDSFPGLVKLQTDLLVSALACDRTRVASLQWSRSFSMVRHTWLDSNEGHHTLSHDPTQKPILTAINRWYTEQLAYLIAALEKVPEGGGSLLDNTLLVYCNELHTGWDHKPGPTPTVLAGRLGGTLRTGRYLDYGPQSPYTQNNLLVSLCHAMGLSAVQSVGNLPGPAGPLPGLFV
jgi:Protein of unknown function (DUF1552)